MTLKFSKFQGTGNDFIMVENLEGNIQLSKEQIQHVCDRKFGVGSDGIILIENSTESDYEMVFYNPDGSQSFCGNGSRCSAIFAMQFLPLNESFSFKAIDGIHHAQVVQEKVSVSIPKNLVIRNIDGRTFLDTGSPHVVIFTEGIDTQDIIAPAREIRYSDAFAPGGTNVNFVERTVFGIRVRTYERGVENETLSCGSGVTACAIAAANKFDLNSPVRVETMGGILEVKFTRNEAEFSGVWLTGPAQKVYEGEIEI